MPLSEFIPTTRAKFEFKQSKPGNSMSDLSSSVPDNEFVELLWENGQIVMQGQSSRPKKSSIPSFSTHPTKVQEKEGKDAVPTRISRFGAVDPAAHDFSIAGISDQIGTNAQDDEMVPWLNYPIDDYCLEFLSEFPGTNTNSLPIHHSFTPSDKSSNGYSQVARDSHSVDQNVSPKILTGSSDPAKIRNLQFTQMPQQWPSPVSNGKSRTLDLVVGNGTATGQTPTWDLIDGKLHKPDPAPPKSPVPPPPPSSGSPGLNNFSHFTRPVALLKANLENVDRLKNSDKASAAASIGMESTIIEPSGGLKSISHGQLAIVPGKGELKSSPHLVKEHASVNHAKDVNWEDASRDKNISTSNKLGLSDHVHGQGSGFTSNLPVVRPEADKGSEPVVASSVCSANGAGVSSHDPKSRVKRKIQEGDDSGYQSEDLEDESTGIKKPATSRSTTAKRSRAAEVHNLSERRRRDRINEKMRALQELIPNCNKVDKASMLDEAIEYLKTLQLQVQIMSMSNGLCMPPMMLPPGMQHLRSPHMAHFSTMGMGIGMGMGMGMGYGMGMVDINGTPLIPVPPLHGPQFACSSIPGNPGLPGMAAPNHLQMFGIPGQGHPMSMSHVPPFVPPSVNPTAAAPVKISETDDAPVKATDRDPCSSLKEQQIQKLNSEKSHETEADGSHISISTKGSKDCLEESPSARIKNHASHSSDEAMNSTSGNGNSSTGTSCSLN